VNPKPALTPPGGWTAKIDGMEPNARDAGLKLLNRLTLGASGLALGAAGAFAAIGAATIPGTTATATTATASTGSASVDASATTTLQPATTTVTAAPASSTTHAVSGASR
jgi:hypothetical protein